MVNRTPAHRNVWQRADFRNRLHRGMTLVELMIVIVIIGILAGIVVMKYQSVDREARGKTQSANVRIVRSMVQVHRHSGKYALTSAGYPQQIFPAWFKGDRIPENAWTTQPMNIQTVAAGSTIIYPLVKTFDPSVPGADNAWYNTDNGRFCALVPPQATDVETLELFNLANASNATSLDQTTW